MKSIFITIISLSGYWAYAQEVAADPVIRDFGEVYSVSPDFQVDVEMQHKVVFDIYSSSESPDIISSRLNTPARYLNMHAQSGVPNENMHVAIVIHGSAFKDILVESAYRAKFNMENPNHDLVKALLFSGVEIILCGQTAAYRKVSKKDLIPGVQIALSAMNALVQLQTEDYQLITF